MSPANQRDRSIHKVFTATAAKGADGTNVFTISTGEVDRDNDRIDPRGWDLTQYKANPVVLYGHDLKSLPIGKCETIAVANGKLKGTITWPPPGCYPFADQVRALVDAGFLRSASVGFRADERRPNDYGGHDITRATLLEWSVVNIPSNPSATLQRGVDHLTFKSWLGGREHYKEEQDMETEKWLEVTDDFFTKDPMTEAFDEMCSQMLANYSEFDSDKFRELMRVQLATLGPLGTIADLVRGIMRDGVTAPKYFDIDERELASTIAHVVAGELGQQTRAALNHAMGRLD